MELFADTTEDCSGTASDFQYRQVFFIRQFSINIFSEWFCPDSLQLIASVFFFRGGVQSKTLRNIVPRLYGNTILFDLQRTSAAADVITRTAAAGRGHIFFVSQSHAFRMLPNRFPVIFQNVANRFIPGLAGKHITIRLDAHTVFGS